MNLVTLTDHDSIDGGLKLLHKPDFFLSVEVSTRFPENDCAVHVLVFDLTPAQHLALQALRDSVYDVCAYLRRQGLAHALPHPMLSPNWKLDAPTLEKCLVLFPVLEAVNGQLDRRNAPQLAHLFTQATPELLKKLSRKHGIELAQGAGRPLAFSAGSDDHGQRRCGTVYVEADGALNAAAFLSQLMDGRTRVVGDCGDLNSMTMCIKETATQYFRRRGEGKGARRNPFVDAMEMIAGRAPRPGADAPRGASAFVDTLLRGARQAQGTPLGGPFRALRWQVIPARAAAGVGCRGAD